MEFEGYVRVPTPAIGSMLLSVHRNLGGQKPVEWIGS